MPGFCLQHIWTEYLDEVANAIEVSPLALITVQNGATKVSSYVLRSHHPREFRLLCLEEAPSCSELNQHGWRLKGIAVEPASVAHWPPHLTES